MIQYKLTQIYSVLGGELFPAGTNRAVFIAIDRRRQPTGFWELSNHQKLRLRQEALVGAQKRELHSRDTKIEDLDHLSRSALRPICCGLNAIFSQLMRGLDNNI